MTGPITVGALGDSFYEYLLKYWLLTKVLWFSLELLTRQKKTSSAMKDWYFESASNIINNLSRKTSNGMLVVTDKAHASSYTQEMEHLVGY